MTSVESREMTLIGPGRRESIVGETVTEIFEMIDFPAAVNGVITLPSGKYIIKNSMSTSDRFAIEPGSVVTFTLENQRFNTFAYTGTETLFTATNAFFILEKTNILLSGAGAQYIDVTGGNFVFGSGLVEITGANVSIGSTVASAVQIDDMFVRGFTDGIVINSTPYGLVTRTIMTGVLGGTGTYISITGTPGFFASEVALVAFCDTNESLFYIEPTIQAPINITNSFQNGTGSYFKSGDTGPIASFTDVSTSPTAVSVTNDSGDALYTAVAHGLNIGETAVHSTFTETSYNGNDVVTEVPTADTYKVGKSYVSDDSGLFETTTCQVNDVGHGLSNGTSLSIYETINFGGGYRIFNVQSDSFEITLGKAFPGSESTGNWDTGSLEGSNSKRSKYVNAFRNGAQPDSSNIGSFVVGGNTDPTDIETAEVFVDLNLNGLAVKASDNELWTLIDSTTGAIRYDGLTPASLNYHGLVAASSLGGAQQFDFRLLRDRAGGGFAELPSPDNVNIPIGVGSALQSTPLGWAIEVEPGDIYKPQVTNMDGIFDITINTLKIIID
jgi:hypothetical protein